MRKRTILTACVVIAVGALAAWLLPRNPTPETAAGEGQTLAARPPLTAAEAASTARRAGADHPIPDRPLAAARQLPMQDWTERSPDKSFRLDAGGGLIVNAQTRLDIEALLARTERQDLPQLKQRLAQTLSPAAAAQALELLDRFDNYQQAQRQAYPPGVPFSTPEEAQAQLEGLHALRVAHFGADTAQAFYGEEEALAGRLIELMQLEKDESLSVEEKAVRAQQLHDAIGKPSASDRNR